MNLEKTIIRGGLFYYEDYYDDIGYRFDFDCRSGYF